MRERLRITDNPTGGESFRRNRRPNMRGIKINPTDRTIEEVDVPNPNNSLQGLYDIIGCDLVQLIELDRGIILVCDEEGKLKPITGAFTFFGNEDLVIAGTAVILGGNANRFGKLHEGIASFEKIVEWVNPADVPEPKFTFIPLTNERI